MKRGFACVLALLVLMSVCPAKADSFDVAYGDAPNQRLDVYSAGGPEAAGHPVAIWVHGAGWRTDDKDNRSGTTLCKTWMTAGVVTINLNYRLTPDVVHPVHVQDVAAGIACA